jgi:NAD(P)-dependent dehydrogenase (short-subunit alcohol dehydrogenase family)
MVRITFELAGRRVLVTGGDAGIGFAIGSALAQAGARVAVNGLGGSATAAAALGLGAIGVDADIGVEAERDRLVARVRAAFDGVDILVLNAAAQVRAAWDAIEAADLERQIAVDLTAAYALIRAFVPGMAARGFGRLIAIGSVQEKVPHPDMLVYGALKAAQTHMIRNLAHQLAPSGVTCNVIAPGVIATERSRAALADPERRAAVVRAVPAGRIGLPEDCAGAALLLASDAGAYVTGAVIPVDGGMSI